MYIPHRFTHWLDTPHDLLGISLLLIFFFIISIFFVHFFHNAMFPILAHWLNQGVLSIGPFYGNQVPLNDAALYGGKLFWPLGPMPTLLFIPIIGIVEHLPLSYFQSGLIIMLNGLNCWLLVQLGKKFGLSLQQALWVSFIFLFASPYIGVAYFSLNSYVGHVVATTWLLGSLDEFYGKRRYWLIGILMGFALATRITAGVGIMFYLLSIVFDPFFFRARFDLYKIWAMLRNFVLLLIPYAACIVFLGWYNFRRFGNPLETGYSYAILTGWLAEARNAGIFSVAHISRNLYHFLLALPRLNVDKAGVLRFPFIQIYGAGMSILVTSFWLPILLFADFKDWFNQKIALTVLAILIPLLLLFSTGMWQFGYRFALDFLPYLFILFIYSIARKRIVLTRPLKSVIVLSAFFNLYLVIFGSFPLFALLFNQK